MHIRVLALIALLTGFASTAAAQNAVAGRVLDPQGAVVVDATVTLTGGEMASPRVLRTGADGGFTFASVPLGGYVLEVKAPGFREWRQNVAAGTGASAIAVTLEVAGVIEDVEVSATLTPTLSTPTPAGSRLSLTALETPASVSVVPGDLIRDLGTQSLIVAKSLAPGITSSAPMGSGGNVLNARGFTGVNSVKQLYNGMEIYNAGGVVSFPFDPWNVDHIAVLAGPASVLYGSGAVGGAVNVVPRRPDAFSRRHEAELSIGSFQTYHAAIDSTGPITPRTSYRVDVSQYASQHWVERGDSSSLAISGALRFDASDRLRFTLSNDFGNQNPSTYLGTPVLNNAPVTGLEKKNYNVDDAELNFTDNWTNLETVYRPAPAVTVRNNTYFMYHDRIYHDVFTFAYVPATDSVRRTQFRDIQDTYQTQYGDTASVQHNGRIFGRSNEVLAGLDYNRVYYHRNDNVRGGTSLVNARTFSPGLYLDFYREVSKPFYRMRVNQIAGFFENRLHVTDKVSVVLGARLDRYHVNRRDEIVPATTESDHNSTGWNSGVVFNPTSALAFYGQFAVASDPVNSFASINANQQGFNLSPGRQIEAGVKHSALGNALEWTFAGYRIVKQDLLTTSVLNPSLTEQVGRQSSRGVEASVAVTAGPFRVQANGTVLDARFDEFAATVGASVVSLAGNVPLNVPERSANLLLFYNATPAVQARAVLRYVGERFADNTNSAAARIPSYSVLDLGGRWKVTPRLSLDLRLDNALDETYADSGSATAWLLGAPRAATLSANVTF